MLQRPCTADVSNRIRKIATDSVFKKWGFHNPGNLVKDLNMTSTSFQTLGTFRPQHGKLMSQVDSVLQKKVGQLNQYDSGAFTSQAASRGGRTASATQRV